MILHAATALLPEGWARDVSIRVEGGRIVWFASFMTGELFAALSDHTILGRLMTARAFDADGFARGLAASAEGGLIGRLFSARTLGLFVRLPGAAEAGGLRPGAPDPRGRALVGPRGGAVRRAGSRALRGRRLLPRVAHERGGLGLRLGPAGGGAGLPLASTG